MVQSDVFNPGRLGPLELRNRVIKSATYEGKCAGNGPTDALIAFHRTIAAGGVGMSTVAYCAVTPDGRTFAEQMYMRREIVPRLRELTDAVHAEGAAASLQLGHCGAFSRNRDRRAGRPLGPSAAVNTYGLMSGLPFAGAMTEADIADTIDGFGRAAALAVEAGFDALEIHLGHGYLLSQFLSPGTNQRRDRWGGSLENRLRLPVAVIRRVREAVGDGVAILTKNNLRDGFRGGLEVEESIEIARRLEAEGVDALVLSGGFTSKTPFYVLRGGAPLREMIAVERNPLQRLVLRAVGERVIRTYPFEELFFLPQARRVREAVRLPLVLIGGVVSLDNMQTALDAGFDFVALGRALIADPDLVNAMRAGEKTRTRCDACNKCVAEMDRPGGVRCVLDDG